MIGVIAANAGGGDSAKSASTAGPTVAPAGADEQGQPAIPVGAADAPSTLTVWEDFRCPACAAFENGFRRPSTSWRTAARCASSTTWPPSSTARPGGGGSLHAANAAACAQDAGKFSAYHDVLYTNQPDETDDAYADNNKLLDLAKKVPGLDTPAFRSCVENGTHNSWVVKSNEAFQAGKFNGTPTVQLNGESIFPMKGNEQITPANLKKWVAQANKGKAPGQDHQPRPRRPRPEPGGLSLLISCRAGCRRARPAR